MTVIAGVDVGNATTEVVLVSGGTILAAGRVPTRGRKGSPDSLRGAAALLRRVERQAASLVDEAQDRPPARGRHLGRHRSRHGSAPRPPSRAGHRRAYARRHGCLRRPALAAAQLSRDVRAALGAQRVAAGGRGPGWPALRRGRGPAEGPARRRDPDRCRPGGRRRGGPGGQPAAGRPACGRPGRRGCRGRLRTTRRRGAAARAHTEGADQPGRAGRSAPPGRARGPGRRRSCPGRWPTTPTRW